MRRSKQKSRAYAASLCCQRGMKPCSQPTTWSSPNRSESLSPVDRVPRQFTPLSTAPQPNPYVRSDRPALQSEPCIRPAQDPGRRDTPRLVAESPTTCPEADEDQFSGPWVDPPLCLREISPWPQSPVLHGCCRRRRSRQHRAPDAFHNSHASCPALCPVQSCSIAPPALATCNRGATARPTECRCCGCSPDRWRRCSQKTRCAPALPRARAWPSPSACAIRLWSARDQCSNPACSIQPSRSPPRENLSPDRSIRNRRALRSSQQMSEKKTGYRTVSVACGGNCFSRDYAMTRSACPPIAIP